jgi:septal ring factor EnvC (AmiA/AmiB activator)
MGDDRKMTEELKQEAEEWSFIKEYAYGYAYTFKQVIDAYIEGAEPREKRIAELEQKLEQTEKDLADYQFNYPTIKELEKENAELKEQQFSLRNERNTFLAQNEQYEKDLIDFNDQLTKAKEIIREFVEWANWQGNSKCPSFKSIQDKAEQFLNENSTYERIQKAKYNYTD